MKRPMFYIWIFLIIGIIFGQYTSSAMGTALFILILTVPGFIVYRKFKMSGVLLLPIAGLLGYILIHQSLMPTDGYTESFMKSGREIRVQGYIDSVQNTSTGKYAMVIQGDKLIYGEKTYDIDVNISAVTDDSGEAGQQVILEGKLIKPKGKQNPMDINELYYMRTENIDYKMYPEIIAKGDIRNNVYTVLNKVSNRLAEVYDNILPEKESGIIKAMILGDKSYLDSDIKELYQQAGVYHILAISGLHITILAGMLLYIFEKIHRRYGKIIVILLLGIYCLMTGCSVSTVRATIMVYIVILGGLLGRDSDTLNSIAAAGVLLLCYEPLYLFDVGFQLSFGAVSGIVIFGSGIKKKWDNGFAEILGAGIGAGIMTKPLLMYYFYKISFIDILLNIIIVPIMGVVVLLGFMAGIVGLVSTALGKILIGLVFGILKVYEVLCSLAVNMPLSGILTGSPNKLEMIIIYGILVCVYFCILRFSKKALVLLSIGVVSLLTEMKADRGMEIVFLNVGQGDCAVIKNNDIAMVIDGGGSSNKPLGKNTGAKVLMPYLNYSGIKRLNGVFVSHTDDDHIKGILEMISKVEIDKIYVPAGEYSDDENYVRLMNMAWKEDIPVYAVKKGDKIDVNGVGEIECIHPEKDNFEDGNNGSMVLRFVYGESSVLFTGDIEGASEDCIISDNTDIRADVLKVAHHGSKTSTSDEFCDKVQPILAVVSAGENNYYNHPSKEVEKRFIDKNIKMSVTAEAGAVIIRTDGNKIWQKNTMDGEGYERIK